MIHQNGFIYNIYTVYTVWLASHADFLSKYARINMFQQKKIIGMNIQLYYDMWTRTSKSIISYHQK